jgi:hypothetical protein
MGVGRRPRGQGRANIARHVIRRVLFYPRLMNKWRGEQYLADPHRGQLPRDAQHGAPRRWSIPAGREGQAGDRQRGKALPGYYPGAYTVQI